MPGDSKRRCRVVASDLRRRPDAREHEDTVGKGQSPPHGAAAVCAAKPDLRGLLGDMALHWAANLGASRLVNGLIERALP